jgi:hypothetical protein
MNDSIINYAVFCYAFSLGCVACEGMKGEQVILLILAPVSLPIMFTMKAIVHLIK